MDQQKKRLKVPYIAELDRLSLEDVSNVLSEKGYLHSMASLNWSDSFSYKPLTSFSLARGNADLYVRFFVHGNCLRAVHETDQMPVFEDSCVGLTLKNHQNNVVYDFAFNCIGACAGYERKSEEKKYIDKSLMRQIRRFTDLAKRPFCEIEGLFSWQLVVAIPFSLIGLDSADISRLLTGNFYKRADATALPHYLSWKPVKHTVIDFAQPEFFGEIELESKK